MLGLTERPSEYDWKSADARVVFGLDGSPDATAIAKEILTEVMRFRRTSGAQASCKPSRCPECARPHLSKVTAAVASGHPIDFVLPAFPGKSPNPAKVLGALPDMAERRSLEFLQHLCDRIKRYYPPGARVTLCSDGRVFSDVVGMREEDVTAYQNELSRMIAQSGLTAISMFNVDDLYGGQNFEQMRIRLMAEHGEPLEALQVAIRRGGKTADTSADLSEDDKELHRLYCGITRFLLEDALIPGQPRSRAALQKESRIRAYQVIQRSKAWGGLVELRFPNAVRLSIHPQSCGSRKLGIRLLEPDNWLTPWHGVAIDVGGRFFLLKRSEAEKIGANLTYREGRPSHYVLSPGSDAERDFFKLPGVRHGA